MNPIYSALCLLVALAVVSAAEQQPQQKAADLQKVGEEMRYITESLNDLIGQLNLIKQEATGRLSKYKGSLTPVEVSSADTQERIRQTKVSKFILKRVSELESESLKMRDELDQLSKVQLRQAINKRERRSAAGAKQEDLDFDELPATTQQAATTTTTTATTTTTSQQQQQGMPATTTMKPEEEAAKIGFDIEALKKLGEEIGKRLDQFGKEAVKNLGDLVEGVKLVFREPKPSPTPPPPAVTGGGRNRGVSTSAPRNL